MNIEKKEVYRYLGIKNNAVDESTEEMAEQCIRELLDIDQHRFCYRLFGTERSEKGILLPECNLLLEGSDMINLLERSVSCVLIAATLGVEVDRRIAFYTKTRLAKGLIMDACATAAIEALCDEVEEEIRQYAKTKGLGITFRFSPGYGDFSLTIQERLLNVLNAYKQIGLTATENSILIPRKSVTAVIGLYPEDGGLSSGKKRDEGCKTRGCLNCGIKNCKYRKDEERNDKHTI